MDARAIEMLVGSTHCLNRTPGQSCGVQRLNSMWAQVNGQPDFGIYVEWNGDSCTAESADEAGPPRARSSAIRVNA